MHARELIDVYLVLVDGVDEFLESSNPREHAGRNFSFVGKECLVLNNAWEVVKEQEYTLTCKGSLEKSIFPLFLRNFGQLEFLKKECDFDDFDASIVFKMQNCVG